MVAAQQFERLVIVEEKHGGVVVVRPQGDLVLATAPRLRASLDACLGPGVATALDLSRIDLMDSSGLLVLIRADRVARTNGWTLELRTPSAEVRRILEVTGALGFLAISE